ncbi:PKD domain-containing protein [uncultured Thiodictyon sp.]|jgi:RHS repeat-associated protein|uniref:PKD domain-containing protein n=1 Tax=uncultured Thiodictyon sp. TaxID=1846217 RepID=UPI0025F810FF|nr:PKD domain-containing protein [uncultured Thiodictyon sp.]
MSTGRLAHHADPAGRRLLHKPIAFLAALWWTLLAGLAAPPAAMADFAPRTGITVETTLPVFDRINNQYSVYANLRNDSGAPLTGPTRLVLTQSSLAVQNAQGTTPAGEPWFSISAAPDFSLAPGARTNRLRIGFPAARTKLTHGFRVETDVPNRPPVANAGPDQTAAVGTGITLDAGASTDPDGDSLTFDWSFLARAPGSAAVLSNPTTLNPSFTLDRFGNYDLGLTVTDSHGASAADSVTVTTENSQPVADAGPDQSVFVGTTVTLDGSASHDVDRDPLTWLWSLTAPSGSAATLSGATLSAPSFEVDLPGAYLGQLIVNDGRLSSDPDTVTVSTENSRPLACVVAVPPAQVGTAIDLVSCSSDADQDPLIFAWSLTSVPDGAAPDLFDTAAATATLVPDLPGAYLVQLIVSDGRLASVPPATLIVTVTPPPANQAPRIDSTAPTQATVGQPYSYAVAATDGDGDTLTYSLTAGPAAMAIDPATGLIQWTPAVSDAAASPVAVGVRVVDGHGGSATQTFEITVASGTDQTLVPTLVGQTRAAAMALVTEARLGLGTLSYRHDAAHPDGEVLAQGLAAGTLVDLGTAVDLSVSLGPDQGLPPNPETVAPPLDPTVTTQFGTATQFLYSGPNAVQTGVAADTIEERRAAVIRGQVFDRAKNPLPGVTIRVLDHPELGQTLSRTDGAFDLVVNGGGLLTLVYEKAGFLTAQRQIQTPWQDYSFAPDCSLVTLDPVVTAIDLTAPSGIQVARGTPSTDGDGTRQATLLVPPGTTAQMVLSDGSTQPLASLHVRVTEYTIGPDGPQAMPAKLPPTSGYTYAVEISADEAMAAGATSVTLSRPVPYYVENFLGFPVGSPVPVGYYDRVKGQWIAAPNGRVIKVVGVTGAMADLDTDGGGSADSPAVLAALGIDDAERVKLAQIYSVGQSLWRVRLDHFTPFDYNWPYGPPAGASGPTGPGAKPGITPTKQPRNTGCGSVIGCEPQTLGEAVAIAGTPFSLHYQSQRTPGYQVGGSLSVDLTEAVVPPGVKRVKVAVSVAGKRVEQNFAPVANQHVNYTWDGRDAFGRATTGEQKATVSVSYVYDAVYYASPTAFAQSFGLASGEPTAITREGSEIGLEQTSSVDLGARSPDGEQVAGWSLSVHHRWDATHGVLVTGDGTETRANAFGATITTVAGNGQSGGLSGDGGPATAASLFGSTDVAVGPDDSLLIAHSGSNLIRRVGPDGRITTVAGIINSNGGFSGDGGPATAADLHYPYGVAVGPDGSLLIADTLNNRIRRVGPDGRITTVAGNGQAGFSGDGGPATAAALALPSGVAVGPDGSLFIADNNRIRRVGPDDRITTVAGNGQAGFSGDGGPATAASLYGPQGVEIGPDGSLLIADTYNYRVRRVGPDGRITTVAGNGQKGFSGDGGPATAASLRYPIGVAVRPDGSLLIADAGNNRIRGVGPDGRITTVAGNGQAGFFGDGGPATGASLSQPGGMAVGPDGSLLIADQNNYRIRRVAFLSGAGIESPFVPSADGAEVYKFNTSGRHLLTLDAHSGGTLYAFSYDTDGRLISVTDGSGNRTTLGRNAAGDPTAIISPDGQRTELTQDANGYLATITNPAGETHRMTYTADGLLTRFEDPRGHASTMTYDDDGRLQIDANAAGGSQTLARTVQEISPGTEVTVTSAEGATTRYKVEDLPIGDQRRTIVQPDGTSTVSVTGTDAKTTSTAPDGTVSTLNRGPDPRFGMSAPVATSQTVATPGGRTATVATVRTATLTNPNDPLSLVTLTDRVTTNGRASTSIYTAATRTTTSTSAASRVSTTVSDALGRPTQTQTAGLAPVAYTYDTRGRLWTVTQGTGAEARAVTFAYDTDGTLAGITDALGRSAGFAYDPAGRVTRQTFPDGRQVQFGYDAKGNLTALTPPGRPAHGFSYTPVDLTADYTPPEVGAGTNSTHYSYNLDKQLTRVLRPDGLSVDLDYDTAGRLKTLTVPEGTLSYGYHATTGRLNRITAPDGGALGLTYDGSLLTGATWTGTVAGSIGFAYDNDLRVSSINVNGANPIAYQYDPDSLLTQAGALTLTRNAQHGLLTGSTLSRVTDTWTYNGFGEPKTYAAAQAGAALLDIGYTRDQLGRIVEKTETIGGVTSTDGYGYDDAGRLVEVRKDGVVQTTWGYDDNGNRTQVNGLEVAHYDDQDRLLDYQGADYAYTANGELLTKTQGANVTRYGYDVLGNLRQVTLPGGTVIDYLTDGKNRRIGKKVNGVLTQGLLYQDQLKPLAQLDGAGNIVSRFVYATRVNVPDYMIKGGTTYRIITDHLGSPRLVVNTATGVAVQRMDYDAWGTVLLDNNPGFQPFGFAGGLYDRDTGLVRFGARDYDAGVGRWLGKDLIGFGGAQTNLYVYALDDPLNFTDPTGQWCWSTFLENYVSNFQRTNEFFFGGWTKLTRTGLSLILGVGKVTGTELGAASLVTIIKNYATGMGGYAVFGGLGGNLAAGAFGAAVNAALVAIALEAGITVGSVLDAAVDAALCDCD